MDHMLNQVNQKDQYISFNINDTCQRNKNVHVVEKQCLCALWSNNVNVHKKKTLKCKVSNANKIRILHVTTAGPREVLFYITHIEIVCLTSILQTQALLWTNKISSIDV